MAPTLASREAPVDNTAIKIQSGPSMGYEILLVPHMPRLVA